MKAIKGKAPITALGLLVAVALALLLCYLLPYLRIFGFIIMDGVKDRQRLVRLLSKTDHQALLEACREISKETSTGNLTTPYRYKVRPKLDPEVSRFPQLVLDTEPLYIEIASDGRLSLEITGALHHCGVTAYPENYEKPNDNFKFGDKKIIDGLWYYEHGYDSKRGKWVEALLEKGKRQREN